MALARQYENLTLYFMARYLLLLLFLTALFAVCLDNLFAQIEEEPVEPPRAVYRAPLYYPPELQRDMISGTVVLDVTVLPDSTIGYIEVKESVPELDSLAIANVREWEFTPALRNGEPSTGVLTVEIDFVPEYIADEVEIPVSAPDLDVLYEKVDLYIEKQQEPFIHNLNSINLPAYNENYHLISWNRYTPIMRKNGFTILPSSTIPIHTFQNYFPLYEQKLTEHTWTFESRDYELPITFVDTYAGLGYLNMDYGHIRLAKNNFLDLENFQIGTAILFQDGYWMGTREKSSNYTLDVRLPLGNHTFSWNFLHVNQDIPPVKFRDQVEYLVNVSYSEKISEHSLTWHNPFLNLGFRYEKIRHDFTPLEIQDRRTTYQILLNRQFDWRQHYLDLTWEYFANADREDSDSLPFITDGSAVYGFKGEKLDLRTELLTGYIYDYYTHSTVDYHVSDNFTAGIGILDNSPWAEFDDYIRMIITRDLYSSLHLNSLIGEVRAIVGQRDYVQYGDINSSGNEALSTKDYTERSEGKGELTTQYISAEHRLKRSYGVTDWSLLSQLNAHLDNDLYFIPSYYGRINLECRYNLLHNNAITAGLVYHHTGEFETPLDRVESTNMLDGYIRISITKLFDIQADARNLLQSESLYGYPVAGLSITPLNCREI